MVKNAIPTYKWKLYSVHGKAGYIPTYKWKLYSVHGKERYSYVPVKVIQRTW